MPNIRDEHTVRAIARAYLENNRNKSRALLSCGYSPNYALKGGRGMNVVFNNDRIKAEISRLEAENRAKQGAPTADELAAQYDEVRDAAMAKGQYGAAVAAITGRARLFGLDKDASADEPERRRLADAEVVEARRIARIRLLEAG